MQILIWIARTEIILIFMFELDEASEIEISEKEYFLEPLIELYSNGRVRFLECVVGL